MAPCEPSVRAARNWRRASGHAPPLPAQSPCSSNGRCRLQSRLQIDTFGRPGPAPRSAPGRWCGTARAFLGAIGEQGAMVDLAVVEQDVRVDVARHRAERCPTNAPISAQLRPCRCRSEILRWRRSCGENSWIPSALHDLAIAVRSASAPYSANSRAVGSRSSRGPSEASSASANSSGRSTQSALWVLLIEARSLTRRRGSS